MKRRDFITLLGGAAAAWPLAARAQQAAMPVIGFLRSATLADVPHWVTAFRRGLKEAGFVEGQNVAIEFRSADNHPDRLPALAADLIRQPVAVIVGEHRCGARGQGCNHDGAHRLRGRRRSRSSRAWSPASTGRAAMSLGSVYFSAGLGRSDWSCCVELVPRAMTIAVLVNPNSLVTEAERRDVQAAARAIGQQLIILMSAASATSRPPLQPSSNAGLMRCSSVPAPFLNSNRERIAALADRHALPAIYSAARGASQPAA